MGFPDNMSYEQRSELRKECSKFLRFSYLVDFLALESLRIVHLNSVDELIKELQVIVHNQAIEYKDRTRGGGGMGHQKEPLFFAEMKLSCQDIPNLEIELETIP